MELIQGWVGLTVVLVASAGAAIAWIASRRQLPVEAGLWIGAADRLRSLPSWRREVVRESRRQLRHIVGWALCLAGLALLSSRLVGVSDTDEELRQRDVVLCMDVSGSMTTLVQDVIDTYSSLVSELTEERIALVMFDANAVTVFPLTDNYDQIKVRLAEVRAEVGTPGPIAGVSAPRSGSSLVGDGLASCVQHFGDAQTDRSRTLVLASDNQVSGDAIYSLTQATDLAVERDVMVFGVVPEGNVARATTEFKIEAGRTHGDLITIVPGAPANASVVANAIGSQERSALLAQDGQQSFDRTGAGSLAVALGLGLLISWRKGGGK